MHAVKVRILRTPCSVRVLSYFFNVPSPFKRRPRDVDLRFLEYFGGYGYGVMVSTLFEKFHELRTYQERRNTSVWNSVLEMSLRNMVMRDIILA